MKKLILSLMLLPILALTACDVRNTGDIKDTNIYETHIYCTYTGNYEPSPCKHCEKWYDVKDEDLRTAYSITCTQFVNGSGGSSHCHYIVTWINR